VEPWFSLHRQEPPGPPSAENSKISMLEVGPNLAWVMTAMPNDFICFYPHQSTWLNDKSEKLPCRSV
jgi:hypothetical protein